MNGFKIMGITGDFDTCECCGKTGLKRTVIMGIKDEDGNVIDVRYYGSNCAAMATRFRGTKRSIEKIAEQAQRDAEEAERNKVVEVNPQDNPDGPRWVVESVGCNGGSITRLCFAKGTRSAIYTWAHRKYPHKSINVRIAR